VPYCSLRCFLIFCHGFTPGNYNDTANLDCYLFYYGRGVGFVQICVSCNHIVNWMLCTLFCSELQNLANVSAKWKNLPQRTVGALLM